MCHRQRLFLAFCASLLALSRAADVCLWSRSDFVDAPKFALEMKPRWFRDYADRGGTLAFDSPPSYALLLLPLLLLRAGLLELTARIFFLSWYDNEVSTFVNEISWHTYCSFAASGTISHPQSLCPRRSSTPTMCLSSLNHFCGIVQGCSGN